MNNVQINHAAENKKKKQQQCTMAKIIIAIRQEINTQQRKQCTINHL